MDEFKNLFRDIGDYDGDGKMDDFELGMFLHEMEMEDRSIMGRLTGRSRIGDIDAFDDADDVDEFDDI